MDDDNDALTLMLETRLKGAEQIEAGVRAANNFARAENRSQAAIRASSGPFQQRIDLQKKFNEAISKGASEAQLSDLKYAQYKNQKILDAINLIGKERDEELKINGIYQRRVQLQEALNRAQKSGSSPERVADIQRAMNRNDKAIQNDQNPEATPGDRLRDAIFSSRYGGGKGGLQPLVGRSLDAISPKLKQGAGSFLKGFGDGGAGIEGAGAAGGAEGIGSMAGEMLGGPEAFLAIEAAKAAMKIGEAIANIVPEAAALTQSFSDLRYQVGGSAQVTSQVQALSAITGVDGGSASRSLRERITTDPMAMAIAARYGVASLPGIYGKRNFGEQYTKLINALASEPNKDAAMRQADALGIGAEVQRLSLVSHEQLSANSRTSDITAQIDTPEAEQRAANFEAASHRVGQSGGNFKQSLGHLFDDGGNLLNWWADKLDSMTQEIGVFDKFLDRAFANVYGPDWLKKREEGEGGESSGGDSSAQSLQIQQLYATQGLVRAMNDNTRMIGGGQNAEGATPVGFTGPYRNFYMSAYANAKIARYDALG